MNRIASIAIACSHGLIAIRSVSLIAAANVVAAPKRTATNKNGSRARKEILATLCSVIFGDLVPVHNVPPCFDVVGATILIVQIIGVFPNIDAEDRRITVH